MKKIILIIIGILIIAVLAGGGVWYWQKNKNNSVKPKNQEDMVQKKEEQNPVAQIPTDTLFAVKKIDFDKQSLENFDKNDPYYNLIINNANKRLGPVPNNSSNESDIEETMVNTYSIAGDEYLFVSYRFWTGSRLAKIDIKTGKVVQENYISRHCDTVCPGYAGYARCYYRGDKNKIVFNYDSATLSNVFYSYWDLNEKSISDNGGLINLDIINDSGLPNYCNGSNTNPTSQPYFNQNQFLPKGAVLNNSIDIDFKNDGIPEKVLAYTIPNGAIIGSSLYDKYYVDVYEFNSGKWGLIKQDQGTKDMINIMFDKVQEIVWSNIDNQQYLAISKNMAGNDPSWQTYLYFYNKDTKAYSEVYPDKIAEPQMNILTSGITNEEANMQLRGFGFTKSDDGFIYGNNLFKVYYKYTGNGQFTFLKKEKTT